MLGDTLCLCVHLFRFIRFLLHSFYSRYLSALNVPAPRTTECVTVSFDCSQLQQEEIANLKKDRDEAEEELEAERTAICEMKTMGRELIANHKHQVAQLEGETLPSNRCDIK